MAALERLCPEKNGDLKFSFRLSNSGEVSILRHARVVTILRAGVAREFLADVDGADFDAQQQLMARVTGNYKRGNERRASDHPRNSDSKATK